MRSATSPIGTLTSQLGSPADPRCSTAGPRIATIPDTHTWCGTAQQLEQATDEEGVPLELVALPTPDVRSVSPQAYGVTSGSRSGSVTDAAYTNYLVTNGVVLLPVYGRPEDEDAKAIIREQFPGREVVGIPALTLTEEGGAVHCVTQQQPASNGS